MANWLVGLKIHNKAVAQVVIRLLHCIIVNEGDLNRNRAIRYLPYQFIPLLHLSIWLTTGSNEYIWVDQIAELYRIFRKIYVIKLQSSNAAFIVNIACLIVVIENNFAVSTVRYYVSSHIRAVHLHWEAESEIIPYEATA